MDPILLLLLIGGGAAAVAQSSKKKNTKAGKKIAELFSDCKDLQDVKRGLPSNKTLIEVIFSAVNKARKTARVQHENRYLMALEVADTAYRSFGCDKRPNLSDPSVPLDKKALYIALLFACQFEKNGKGLEFSKSKPIPELDFRSFIWRNGQGEPIDDDGTAYMALLSEARSISYEANERLSSGESLSVVGGSELLDVCESALDNIYEYATESADTYYREMVPHLGLTPGGAQDVLAASVAHSLRGQQFNMIDVRDPKGSSWNARCAKLLLDASAAVTRYGKNQGIVKNSGYLDRYYTSEAPGFEGFSAYYIYFNDEVYKKACRPMAKKLLVTPGFSSQESIDLEKVVALALAASLDWKNAGMSLDARLTRAIREEHMPGELLAIYNTPDSSQIRSNAVETLHSRQVTLGALFNGILNRLIDDGTVPSVQFG